MAVYSFDANQINQKLSAVYKLHTEEFLEEYKNCYPMDNNPPNRINEFGVIDENRFNYKNRILFVLKETNGWRNEDYTNGILFRYWVREISEGNFAGKDHAKKYPKLWYNIGRWASLLHNQNLDIFKLAKETKQVLHSIGTVAITNINKVRGSSSSKSCYTKIASSNIAEKVLKKEVNIINPDTIVCCGTWQTVCKHLSDFQGKMICMPHPSAPRSTVEMLQCLSNQL